MKAVLYIKSPTRDLLKFREIEVPEFYPVYLVPMPSRITLYDGEHLPPPFPIREIARFVRRSVLPTGEAIYVLEPDA